MTRAIAVVAGAALTTGLAAAGAGAESGAVGGARGVESVALHAAKAWGDPHPRDIRFATGTLEHAMAVLEPQAIGNPNVSPNGPDAQGGADSEVDLIAVWGHFHANVSGPRGAKAPAGNVMELIVDTHSGFVEMRSLRDRIAAPLSRLGPVTDLHKGSGGSPPHFAQ